MPAYLLTYDLKSTDPDPHSLVRTELGKAGWYARIKKDSLSWAYPDTTRSGTFVTDAAAIAAYRSAIQNAKTEAVRKGKGTVEIEKVYITQRTEVLFETDDRKPSTD